MPMMLSVKCAPLGAPLPVSAWLKAGAAELASGSGDSSVLQAPSASVAETARAMVRVGIIGTSEGGRIDSPAARNGRATITSASFVDGPRRLHIRVATDSRCARNFMHEDRPVAGLETWIDACKDPGGMPCIGHASRTARECENGDVRSGQSRAVALDPRNGLTYFLGQSALRLQRQSLMRARLRIERRFTNGLVRVRSSYPAPRRCRVECHEPAGAKLWASD